MYNRTQVFTAACTALFLFGITLITLGSILPLLPEKFEGSDFNAATLVSLLPLGILGGSLVFGPIADRYGYKFLLAVSILISAIALEGIAFTRSLFILHACIFLGGFGGGIINGATSALVADISPDNKGASLSILGVFFGLGALGMPLLLGLLSKYYAYETILAAVGLFMLIPITYTLMLKFPLPKQARGFPLKAGTGLLKEPALLLTGFFLFFQSGVESLVNNWTTSYLRDKLHTPAEDNLYALSFSLVGLTVGRLLLGSLLRKISSGKALLGSLLLVAGGSLLMMATWSYPQAFAGLMLCGLGLAAGFPVILGYIGQLYAHLSGTAFSIALVIALLGNTLINYFFGIIAKSFTTVHLPLAILSCIICMIILLAMIRQKIKGRVRL